MTFFEYVDDDTPATLRRSGFLAVRETDLAVRVDLNITITMNRLIRAVLSDMAIADDGTAITPIDGLTITKVGSEAVSQTEEGITDQDL